MNKPRLFLRLFPALLLITALALGVAGWDASRTLGSFHEQMTSTQLTALARLLGGEVAARELLADPAALQALCVLYGGQSPTRFTVVDAGGTVLADTEEPASRMRNHADRPEIAAAMRGEVGLAKRYSNTVRRNMVYVAVPVGDLPTARAVVRASRPLALLDEQLRAVYRRLAGGALVAGLVALLLSIMLARSISRPLHELQDGATRFAAGDLGRHLPGYDSFEMDALAKAMNSMGDQLATRLEAIKREHGELTAILASMAEGVLAIDGNGVVSKANRAALGMLGVAEAELLGRPLAGAVRNPQLEDLVAAILRGQTPVDGEVVVHSQPELLLHVHGSQLLDPGGQRSGAVVVLNDITQLRRLETMRRQFASNVSHELKTPITSIQGFVETLLDGALDESPQQVRHFLEIIFSQAKRLHAITEDILLLSRVEQGGVELDRRTERLAVGTVVDHAFEQCAKSAAAKQIALEARVPAAVFVEGHARLLEQAIVNLVGNAINYSPPRSTVVVQTEAVGGQVVVRVIDQGIGIAKEHLPRIFERFYRVDKARSREIGGTGLGLAIVKHIVQFHHGTIAVESTPGQGSTFIIRLPADRQSRTTASGT